MFSYNAHLLDFLVKPEEVNENLFHPEFLLKKLPDIPCAKLPAPPKAAIQKTMKDYLVSVDVPAVLRSVEKVTKELRTPTKVKVELPDSPIKEPIQPKRQGPTKARMNLLERVGFTDLLGTSTSNCCLDSCQGT